MTTKSREYIRELSSKEIDDLKERYKHHIKPIRKGFLNTDDKNILLQISRWSPHTADREVYDFFYDVRERAKSALLDLQILCDTLNEEQLQHIFGTKQKLPTKDKFPITEVLSSLLPSKFSMEATRQFIADLENQIASAKIDRDNNKDRPEEVKRLTEWINANERHIPIMKKELPKTEAKLQELEWRKYILEDVTLKALKWYLNSGLFQTDAHQRLIIDLMDAIVIASSGKKKFYRSGLARSEIGYFPYGFSYPSQ